MKKVGLAPSGFIGILKTTTILEHGNESLTQKLLYLFVFSS